MVKNDKYIAVEAGGWQKLSSILSVSRDPLLHYLMLLNVYLLMLMLLNY